MNTVAETTPKTPDRYETPVFNLPILAPEQVEAVQTLNGWPIDGVRVGGGARFNYNHVRKNGFQTEASIAQVANVSGSLEYLYPEQHLGYMISARMNLAHFGQNPTEFTSMIGNGGALDAGVVAQIQDEAETQFGPDCRKNKVLERVSGRSNLSVNVIYRHVIPFITSDGTNTSGQTDMERMQDSITDATVDESVLVGGSLNLKTTLKRNTVPINIGDDKGDNSIVGNISVGVYHKFNVLTHEPGSWVLRIEGGVAKHFGFSALDAGGYGVAEIDLETVVLRWFRGSDGETHIGLLVPGSETVIDISTLGQAMPDALTSDVAMLDPQQDAHYFGADGTAKVLDLGLENIGDQVQDFLSNYIPDEALAGMTALAAYAPLAMTTAQYAPTAYRTARVAQAINTAVRSGTARALVADSGPAIVYSAGIAMTIQTLTNPAVVNYALTGQQNPALSITSSLDDTLTEVSPWAFDTWVADGDASYPHLLDILQAEAGAPERTGQAKAEAQGYIDNTPALRYLDGLEGYARTHGLVVFGGNAAAIAEDLVQNARPAERPQIIADLENQFGLMRDQDDLNQKGGWWVTASEVDQGSGKPMKDQGKLWDKLAAMWRSEFQQKQIDRERAVEVISTFAQNLGLHITPEIAAKIADKART